jgi:hypothetical protein
MAKLGPDAAHIFRITHVRNVPWILAHGLDCKSSNIADPAFVPIGMSELIEKRSTRAVPVPPAGSLGDYVPFYFTPWSVMLYNIKTGHNNVTRRANPEIAILVSSLHTLKRFGVDFVFTNGHAYMQETDYFTDLANLGEIDWEILRRKDFQRDPEDPGKIGRYQAEALVHRHLPVGALHGIACYDDATKSMIETQVQRQNLELPVKAIPQWYF